MHPRVWLITHRIITLIQILFDDRTRKTSSRLTTLRNTKPQEARTLNAAIKRTLTVPLKCYTAPPLRLPLLSTWKVKRYLS